MDYSATYFVLVCAFILDFFIGDPDFRYHPIRMFGRAIDLTEPRFRKWFENPFAAGLFFALFLIVAAWGAAWFVHASARGIHPAFGTGVDILLVWFCISARSLESAAMKVAEPLNMRRTEKAKEQLARIVGRDTHNLTETGIARAGVETVAENLVDGVISPLFYAAIGGAPLALAYKMVNTLDSMVGYKNEKYADFGKASARIDDIANYVPARVSVGIVSIAARLLGKKGMRAFGTGFMEGNKHASPNAGYPEAAFAGALGIRLGGPNYYQGRLVEKPWIGPAFGDPNSGHIRKACDLMMLSSLIWVCVLSLSDLCLNLIW